MLRARVTQ
jgi:hypothetical protein